jgi:hypothetical protein
MHIQKTIDDFFYIGRAKISSSIYASDMLYCHVDIHTHLSNTLKMTTISKKNIKCQYVMTLINLSIMVLASRNYKLI